MLNNETLITVFRDAASDSCYTHTHTHTHTHTENDFVWGN